MKNSSVCLFRPAASSEDCRGRLGKIIHKDYDAEKHYYGMGIDSRHKCIGCGRCVEACKTENNVPKDPYYFRTWVERYVIKTDGA